MIDRDAHARNRAAWNEATRRHNAHKADQAGFLRGGGSTLFPEELDLLGEIAGQRVVHLCCNAGQDTLSLAALGAQVTGVDIADEAIRFARQLSSDSGLPGAFVRADVFDWLAAVEPASFDVAFASYGALDWLSDLPLFLKGVARCLRPGGRLVIVEFHSLAFCVDETGRMTDAYFCAPTTDSGGLNDYVGAAGGGLSPMGELPVDAAWAGTGPVTWQGYTPFHVIDAVAQAGLVLRHAREWPYTNGWRPFDAARPLPGRRWTWPEGNPVLPMMYGLLATKEGL